jgi:predicted unusual protein kinase regulating ubiquinone biosynthesis (AarF/ABC1/UbiB family)
VGKRLLELLLLELFQFRFMQTDPNPGNYLFDEATNSVVLLDFGASRHVPEPVSDLYREILRGIALCQRPTLEAAFTKLGVLHDGLNVEARNIIVSGALYLSEVLSDDHPFDFGTTNLAQRMHEHGKELRRFRSELRPPPLSYLFFQRKLGGAFLLSRQLRASINCNELLFDVGVLARGEGKAAG